MRLTCRLGSSTSVRHDLAVEKDLQVPLSGLMMTSMLASSPYFFLATLRNTSSRDAHQVTRSMFFGP